MTNERYRKHDCIFLGSKDTVGHNHLDQPVKMFVYKFYDRETGYYLRWMTEVRLRNKVNSDCLFSATPLSSRPTDFGHGPEMRVTRGKVYDAPAES